MDDRECLHFEMEDRVQKIAHSSKFATTSFPDISSCSPELLPLLFRWSALKDTPSQVAKEIDSLLFHLSQNIICPEGGFVAVNVSNFRKNRFVGT